MFTVPVIGAVADRAEGQTAADQRLLPRQPQAPVGHARGQDQGPGAAAPRVRGHQKAPVRLRLGVERLLVQQLRPLFLRLFLEPGGEVHATEMGETGIVLHQRGVDDLAAGEFLFQQQDVLAGAGGVEGGGHAGGAGADDEDIVHNGNFLSLVVLFRKGRTLESARDRGFVA